MWDILYRYTVFTICRICAKVQLLSLSPRRPEPTNFLIKNNASLSSVDKVNRNTALHCAVLAGNVDAADVLLEAGASVDAENINVSPSLNAAVPPSPLSTRPRTPFRHIFYIFLFMNIFHIHHRGQNKGIT